jgi:probable selenium-dependent hydroxylase accessory protein YqeC
VVVAALDALGQPLDAERVHRLEVVCSVTGRAAGETIDEDVVVAALTLGGYPRVAPPGCSAVVFLNKAEGAALEAAAARLAPRLVPPYAAALAGSARAGTARRLA